MPHVLDAGWRSLYDDHHFSIDFLGPQSSQIRPEAAFDATQRDLRDKAKMTREDGVFTLKLDECFSHAQLVSFAEDMFPGVSAEDIGVWPAEEGELVVPRRRRSCAELTKRHALYRVCWNRSPRSLFAARHSAHFTLIQHFPERYGASFFFETMPSRPRLRHSTSSKFRIAEALVIEEPAETVALQEGLFTLRATSGIGRRSLPLRKRRSKHHMRSCSWA
jgi:hypothetical protein